MRAGTRNGVGVGWKEKVEHGPVTVLGRLLSVDLIKSTWSMKALSNARYDGSQVGDFDGEELGAVTEEIVEEMADGGRSQSFRWQNRTKTCVRNFPRVDC